MDINKKIVIVCDYGYYDGGAAKVAIDSAIGLSDYGYDITYFCAVGPVENKLKKKVNNIICLHQHDILNNPSRLKAIFQGIYNIKAYNELNKLLELEEYKNAIVHIHSWTKSLSSSIFKSCNKNNVKVLLTLHDYFSICPNGGLYNYKKNTICFHNPLSLKCLLCNCDSRNYAQKIWRIIRQFVQNSNIKKCKNINYLYISNFQKNIVSKYINNDLTYIANPIECYPNLKIDFNKNNYYLFIGRLSPEKGCELFCRAISELNKEGIVIGDGSLLSDLKEKYNNIKFVGWKNKNEILKYIKKAKCFILSSICYEADPLSVHEACGIGMPCIVPNNCAASDQIKDGINGLIYQSNNLDSLKEKIMEFEERKIVCKQTKQNTIDDYCRNYKKYIG